MSALSYEATPGNGGNTTFQIDTFSEDEIKVYVNEVLKTKGSSNDYQISNYTATGGRIDWVGSAPTSNDRIRIVRQTKILNNGGNAVEGKATYSAGAAVKAADLNNNTKQVLRSLQEHNDQLIQTYDLQDDAVTSAKIDDGTIVEGNLANSAVTQNKLANNSVGTPELINGSVNSDKILDGTIVNADVNASAAIAGTKISPVFGSQTVISTGNAGFGSLGITNNITVGGTVDGRDVAADGTKLDGIESNATADQTAAEIKTLLQSNKLTTNEIANDAVTIDKIADAAIVTNSEQSGHSVNDNTFFTTAAAEARYFNASTGETIKDGQAFPDNDTTIATTAAINDRIIDLIDDVGGFDIIQSEQHFPNTNPQGTTGQSAVISVKAATTNLVPSGTTVTISNGNLANNANITITGVTSTIPTGFGFLVESTSTLHEYAFHRLVPKATEVTTIASNISNINSAANNESNINAAVSNASNINAAVANASNINAAVSNASNINAAVSNASNINSAVSNASNITTTASNIANVNNVGTNIAKVNSVAAVLGGTQTFTVTVSGGVFYIDGQSKPVLTLARGFTYTFNQADSSNSGHPLAFRDSSDNAYTTGVTVNGTAGSSGATVVFAVPSNAPSSLKYYCTVHGNGMGNTITVTDDNIGTVAGSISNVNTVAGSISNVNTVGGSISNVNTVASNINSVNSFFNTYRIGTQNPQTSLNVGDLFFNQTSNSLKVYTGSAWVDGVTATGNFAVVTGNTFTGSNNHNDNVKSIYGTGSDFEIFHDGSHSRLVNSTGVLSLQGSQINIKNEANNEFFAKFIENGSVDLYYDNSKKFQTTSSGVKINDRLELNGNVIVDNTANGNNIGIMFDSSGGIVPTAGSGQRVDNSRDLGSSSYKWRNVYATTYYGDGSNLTGINTDLVSDTSPQLGGNLASNGNNIDMADNDKIQLGTGTDFEIYHKSADNSNYIESQNGRSLFLEQDQIYILNEAGNEYMIHGAANGAVQLRYDNSKKFETSSTGGNFLGNLHFNDGSTLSASNKITMGDSSDLQLYHNGTNSYVITSTGQLFLQSTNSNVWLQGNEGGMLSQDGSEYIFRGTTNGSMKLFYDNSLKFETTSGGNQATGLLRANSLMIDGSSGYLSVPDGKKAFFGTGDDLEIYHSSNNNFINTKTGSLFFDYNGSTVCYQTDTSLRFLDSKRVSFGTGNDVEMYHNGSNFYIDNDTGHMAIRNNVAADVGGNIYIQPHDNEDGVVVTHDGNVQLFYDNVKRFETTSVGAEVTGHLKVGAAYNYIGAEIIGGGSGYANPLVVKTANGTTRFTVSGDGKAILPDLGKFVVGDGNDLEIYHSGGINYINLDTAGNLDIKYGSEFVSRFGPNGSCELYYDNSKKLETYSGGVYITGRLKQSGSNADFLIEAVGPGGHVKFVTTGADRWYVEGTNGHFIPTANNTYDIGNSSYRVRNIYTNDLHLSNEGSSNDVDGTWGDWTMQEGESDLFLKNNRSGKKYKFNLTEVS